ncbi:MAG TPA: chromosomal replication initiator protein DnaA [Thermomicrobiales bacterium]|nr:chromosomal replication initiator protein DnaA [Thermomicrobiales bacterium]
MYVNQLWQATLEDLRARQRVAERDYKTWLQPTRLISLDRGSGAAVVGAPDTMTVEQLAKGYREQIARSLGTIAGRAVTIEFTVLNQEPAARPGRPAAAKPAHAAPGPRPSRPAAPAAQQLELGAASNDGLNPRYVFDNFIVGGSNRLAHAASRAVADAPGGVYNPLFIYGGVGLGKTHLLHAIGHSAREHFGADLRVLYVTSERFTNELVAAIRGGKQEDFRDRYRTNDILMVDDIQFIGGKESTQEEVFHTFNHLHQAGKQIVLSSDRPPKAIATLDDRLRSRFEWGLTVDVQPPDLETRIAILQEKGAETGVHVPRDVLDYVAQKVQSNIRELEGTLTRIVAHARLNEAPITLALATEAMNDPQMNSKRKLITLPRILATVARFYDVSEQDIRGKSRMKEIVIPRQVAMFIMREETDRPLTDIGAALARDHTTVLHGIEKVEQEIERNADRRQEVLTIRELLYAD